MSNTALAGLAWLAARQACSTGHECSWEAPFDDAQIARRVAAVSARRIQTIVSASGFFNRFTSDEQAAVWSAATANPAIGVG